MIFYKISLARDGSPFMETFSGEMDKGEFDVLTEMFAFQCRAPGGVVTNFEAFPLEIRSPQSRRITLDEMVTPEALKDPFFEFDAWFDPTNNMFLTCLEDIAGYMLKDMGMNLERLKSQLKKAA